MTEMSLVLQEPAIVTSFGTALRGQRETRPDEQDEGARLQPH